MKEPKIIETPSLVESIRSRLISDIMEHLYVPGQKIPIMEIAARYGVSETPVKQAFNRLVSEGLLEAIPRRGVVVKKVSGEEVRELMEARQLLNLLCVDASLNCSDQVRKEMDKGLQKQLREHKLLIEKIEQPLSMDLYMNYILIDREYHTIFLRSIQNKTIERMYEQLRLKAYGYISKSEIMADRIRQAYSDHVNVYEAWKAGDKDKMIDAINDHKNGALDTIEKVYRNEK